MILQALDPSALAVREILAESDAFTLALYPGEIIHLESPEALKHANVYFLGFVQDGLVIACGAARSMDHDYAEIKRVFVREAHRGNGYSKVIVQSLEAQISRLGTRAMRLVTGSRQTAALHLYRGLGYTECAAYGAHQAGLSTVFMEKHLG